jgi:microcystin-dependent protein
MSFIKELRSYFFRANAPINPNVPGDKKDNLQKEGVPSQDTMERLTASFLNFRERKDRAKQAGKVYTNPDGTFISPDEDFELAGHVQIATDAEAKAWTDGMVETAGNESTKVVHPQQLPDVNSDNQTTTNFNAIVNDSTSPAANIETITSTIDPTETRRNNFLLRVSAGFQTYLNNIVESVSNVMTFVYGTGGRNSPGDNGSGLSGIIYGTNGTPGAPGSDGLMTYVFGPNYDPSNPGVTSCPSVMCDLYGQDGLPGVPGIPGTGGITEIIAKTAPIGVIQMYPKATAPVGDEWMVCNGSVLDSVSDPTLAELFTVIGTTFGGTGASNFLLPNMEERFPIGAKSGTTPVGQSVDNNSFTLTESQVPLAAHTHGSSALSVTGTINSTGSSHRHALVTAEGVGSGECEKGFNIGGSNGSNHRYTSPGTSNGNNNDPTGCTGATLDGDHTHGHNLDIAGNTDNNSAVPASATVDNKPSYLSLSYIIKVR